jgi:8-oxo-dGTP diphosphatase
VAVDIVMFTVVRDHLEVLLIERGIPPYQGSWALPGGFVLPGESLEDAARRELRDETGVRDVFLEQLYTFGEPGRDPRGRVVSVAWYALISGDRPLQATSDAADARWWTVSGLPPLAFDHDRILGLALERLRGKLEYTTVGFQLLPPRFTLTELQTVYEAILDRKLDKRNFRRRIDMLDLVGETDELRRDGAARPARLYTFKNQTS